MFVATGRFSRKTIMARPKKPARGVTSKAIRDYLTAHKKAKPKEVIAALAEQGVTVTGPMVSNMKTRMKLSRRRKKVARTSGEVSGFSLQSLLAAKKLVNAVGGFQQAREVVNALEKLS
jgi:arginine repressor